MLLQLAQRVLNYHVDQNVLCKYLRIFDRLWIADECCPVLHVYPSIFTQLVTGQSLVTLASVIKTWAQGVRDKEFLVSMQLQNLEQESKAMDADTPEAGSEDIALADEDEED